MMNLSLSAASRGQLGTPPLGRRHQSPVRFVTSSCLRDARSPSPASYPESILRVKQNHAETHTASVTVKSNHQTHHKLCSNNHHMKISSSTSSSSPAALATQISQISLATGTAGLDTLPPKPVSEDELAKRLQAHTSDPECPDYFLLDCRSFISFNLKKIRSALNVCCTDRCSRRRLTTGKSSILDMVKGTDAEKDSFKKYLQSTDIILYDDSTKALGDLKDTNNTLQLVGKVLQLQGANVMYLKGKQNHEFVMNFFIYFHSFTAEYCCINTVSSCLPK